MTTQIAIIDPFIKNPAVNCFNGLVDLLGVPATYHIPNVMGLESVHLVRPKTSAYIVLGSASHVHEGLPWQLPLAEFLKEELLANKPILGCCFGHQLMCHVLGSKVEFHTPDELKLTGVRAITVTENFWNFKKGESFTLGVTHKQVVRNLGPGLKAVGEGLLNDLVIHETLPFMGTQAHPEASEFFCQYDIQNLSAGEKQLVRKDGQRLISRFFQHFSLV